MYVVEPSVKLITNTENYLSTLYIAAKRCTSDLDYENLQNKIDSTSNTDRTKLIIKCYEAGHESILEHVSMTFHITCSRACSHQLVRH